MYFLPYSELLKSFKTFGNITTGYRTKRGRVRFFMPDRYGRRTDRAGVRARLRVSFAGALLTGTAHIDKEWEAIKPGLRPKRLSRTAQFGNWHKHDTTLWELELDEEIPYAKGIDLRTKRFRELLVAAIEESPPPLFTWWMPPFAVFEAVFNKVMEAVLSSGHSHILYVYVQRTGGTEHLQELLSHPPGWAWQAGPRIVENNRALPFRATLAGGGEGGLPLFSDRPYISLRGLYITPSSIPKMTWQALRRRIIGELEEHDREKRRKQREEDDRRRQELVEKLRPLIPTEARLEAEIELFRREFFRGLYRHRVPWEPRRNDFDPPLPAMDRKGAILSVWVAFGHPSFTAMIHVLDRGTPQHPIRPPVRKALVMSGTPPHLFCSSDRLFAEIELGPGATRYKQSIGIARLIRNELLKKLEKIQHDREYSYHSRLLVDPLDSARADDGVD